ncbi:Carboxymethylproline synthase [Colletotrichum spinosum]|uniref:Carboxymethylproline synthase n=1 Tax=Colletotrichum spinosum TaxID=1347390 RepID=A0A4R8QMZ9_9PEZI|nr:Carboxymethylproline synthase [Colletotrichum spinosum]
MPGSLANGSLANGSLKNGSLTNGSLTDGSLTNGSLTNGSSPVAGQDSSEHFVIHISSGTALVEFSKGNRQNPFSRPKMRELTALTKKLADDEQVGCIVLTGGEGRSFSAGGDFHETSHFTGGDEVDAWIDDFTHLYTTIAGISKPVVAAMDGYAIGLGLQIALCCDYRIGADTCQLVMPEFRMGIACNFGGLMLEATVGRSVMQKMLFTAERWDAPTALRDGLLHEVVPARQLVARALERARTISSWAPSAVRGTRPYINASFCEDLVRLGESAKRTHRSAFAAGDAQKNMKTIIDKSQNHVQVRTAEASPSWVLFASTAISSLEKHLQTVTASGIHVYGQGRALNSGSYTWLDGDDAASPSAHDEWDTFVESRGDILRARAGAMSDRPLYVTRNTTTGAWAIGTDAFTLHLARSRWGMHAGLTNSSVIYRDETTAFIGVSKVPSHSGIELRKTGSGDAQGGRWKLSTEQFRDPILAALSPQIRDFALAGSSFVSALQGAVSQMTRNGDGSVATLLSGGIDSGAVTAFAVLSGLEVTAYSAGTPWGNEHSEARELCDFFGIPHVCVDFSAEELLAAVPESIRAMGHSENERVDITITITAMLRSGVIKEKHILTGYGSDLVNLGLPPSSGADDVDALIADIIDGVDCSRNSNEFTDLVANTYGKRLSHPYWHKDVVLSALDIHPACKIRDGREKAFFRAAMEPYVPMTTAWRKKIGIHLGGGLQGGLDAAFGSRELKTQAYDECFRAIASRVLQDGPLASVADLSPRVDHHLGQYTPMTPSGAGRLLRWDGTASEEALGKLSETLLGSLEGAGFVLVKNLPLAEEQFKSLVHRLGDPVRHKWKTGSSDLMKLNATHDKGNVVLGRGPLPLHTDGILIGQHPDLIMLYAADFSDEPGSGETFIVDQVRAGKEMPSDLRERLSGVTFEYHIQEQGHYPTTAESEQGIRVPPLQVGDDGEPSLRLCLPFPPGIERSWAMKAVSTVPGVDVDSAALLADLERHLLQPRYMYQHRWSVNDFLVFENKTTLHGRTAISEGGVRSLYRAQVHRRA